MKSGNYYSNVGASFVLFCHRICKLLGVQLYYHSRYGVKVLNRIADRNDLHTEYTSKINPSDILFFADGLIDEYSFTGKALVDSPHYNLVKGVIEKDDSLCLDYLKREINGTLDGRFKLNVNDETILMHKKSTWKNKELIETGKYKHPLLLFFDNHYYALDGKHRLAMAAYLSKNIDCDVVSCRDIVSSDYIVRLYKKMSRFPLKYSKNLDLLASIRNHYQIN